MTFTNISANLNAFNIFLFPICLGLLLNRDLKNLQEPWAKQNLILGGERRLRWATKKLIKLSQHDGKASGKQKMEDARHG